MKQRLVSNAPPAVRRLRLGTRVCPRQIQRGAARVEAVYRRGARASPRQIPVGGIPQPQQHSRASGHRSPKGTMIVYPPATPPYIRTAQAQPPAPHRRRHSRPHHRRHGKQSLTARQPHSNGLLKGTMPVVLRLRAIPLGIRG